MSALNMIVRGQHAHLLTDRAVYDGDGVVRGIGTKVGRLETLPLALSTVGVCDLDRLSQAVDRLCPNSPWPEDWVAALPAVLRAIRSENASLFPEGEAAGFNEITLCAIYYSRRQGLARGVIVTTADPSLPAYALVGLACITIPSAEPAAGAPDPRLPGFNPRRDGFALVEAQRRTAWSDGMYAIGGGVDLTTVGPEGLQLEMLGEWPDAVGSKIDVTAQRLAA